MRTFKKIFAFLLALMMLLSFAACGEEDASEEDVKPYMEMPEEALGAVVLVGNIRLTLYYNKEGNIVSITNQEENVCFQNLTGNTCKDAVVKLLKSPDVQLVGNFLLIKQLQNTTLPSENFLKDITAEAEKIVGNTPLFSIPAEELNEYGYFSADIAKALLDIQLGLSSNAECTVSSQPIDGYFHATVSVNGESTKYTIGAIYGSVTEVSPMDTEFSDGFTDDYMDPGMIDSYVPNEDPIEGNAPSGY